ncbi:MAG: SDR family oxidoreductase [Clostridia bacterium]|nr:SDR family oxidoreductase [Clostridia bacterium]MBN2884261.1 SDR family oxidoreductase [Clostridia bacterium]
MINIKEKWVLITGASRGIGYEAAVYLAGLGCNLVLHSRKKEHLDKVYKETTKNGISVKIVEADLGKPENVNALLEELDSLNVDIDIILNNAGMMTAYHADFHKTPVEDFNISFQVNLIAPLKICYHFLPKMEKRGFGRIVNTTSGIMNTPELAGYSGSKAALDKCTADIGTRYEGTDVMINLVDPGWLRTDLGGNQAPNDVSTCIPGVVMGAVLDDKKSGRIIRAQEFLGMNLKDAVEVFQSKER